MHIASKYSLNAVENADIILHREVQRVAKL